MLPATGIVNVAAVDCDEHKSIAGEHGVQVSTAALLLRCTDQHHPSLAGPLSQVVGSLAVMLNFDPIPGDCRPGGLLRCSPHGSCNCSTTGSMSSCSVCRGSPAYSCTGGTGQRVEGLNPDSVWDLAQCVRTQ